MHCGRGFYVVPPYLTVVTHCDPHMKRILIHPSHSVYLVTFLSNSSLAIGVIYTGNISSPM